MEIKKGNVSFRFDHVLQEPKYIVEIQSPLVVEIECTCRFIPLNPLEIMCKESKRSWLSLYLPK